MGSCKAIFLVFLLMGLSSPSGGAYVGGGGGGRVATAARGRECSEIYVVREGETLHSISDKCDDPFILENNPHIQQHDDVSPGLVIKITNFTIRRSRKLLAWTFSLIIGVKIFWYFTSSFFFFFFLAYFIL